jgi:hypothetical protein
MEGLKQHQIIAKLKAVAERIQAQSSEYRDLDVRIMGPAAPGRPYTIDVSQGRVSRQVTVDMKSVQQMQYGMMDAMVTRELRTAMLAVSRLGHGKKS